MSPLLVVIVTFGLIFTVLASLGQGFAVTTESLWATVRTRGRSNVTILVGSFVVLPLITIGLASLIDFNPQVKMGIVVLSLTAGAPFIPMLVARGKGDVGYSVVVSFGLLLVTLVVLPLAMPPLLRALNTGASPSVWLVAWPMLLFILLPLLVGMICRARYPEFVVDVRPWLMPIALLCLVIHVCLYIGYSWHDFVSLAGYGQMAFTLVFPVAGMLIGYLIAAGFRQGDRIVSAVGVAQQSPAAVICCLIFPLGAFEVAGDYALLGSIVTIVVVLASMLEVGKHVSERSPVLPQSRVAQPVVQQS